jgi:hypothetical protein
MGRVLTYEYYGYPRISSSNIRRADGGNPRRRAAGGPQHEPANLGL